MVPGEGKTLDQFDHQVLEGHQCLEEEKDEQIWLPGSPQGGGKL